MYKDIRYLKTVIIGGPTLDSLALYRHKKYFIAKRKTSDHFLVNRFKPVCNRYNNECVTDQESLAVSVFCLSTDQSNVMENPIGFFPLLFLQNI